MESASLQACSRKRLVEGRYGSGSTRFQMTLARVRDSNGRRGNTYAFSREPAPTRRRLARFRVYLVEDVAYERSRCRKSFSGMISILPPASRKLSAFLSLP